MQIGKLAKTAGVSIQTVRYYERYGVLREPNRKPSSYRIYGQIEKLSKFRSELMRAVRSWKKTPQGAPSGDGICVLIERTMAERSKR